MIRSGNYTSILDRGRVRISNDDNVLATINGEGDILLIVCDGMGGYKRGDFASRIVIDTFKDEFINHSKFINRYHAVNWISKIIRKTNKIIFNYAQEQEYKDMGTTIALVLIFKKYIVVAYAGDSRVYFYDDKQLKQISEDQTYVEYLYKKGEITKDQMLTHPNRHTLTNAIGIFPSPNIAFDFYKNENQSILLCSDGLYNNLTDNEIHAIISTNELIETKAKTLVACANGNGGSDNIAIALWEPEK